MPAKNEFRKQKENRPAGLNRSIVGQALWTSFRHGGKSYVLAKKHVQIDKREPVGNKLA